jgi:hypothetical protein
MKKIPGRILVILSGTMICRGATLIPCVCWSAASPVAVHCNSAKRKADSPNRKIRHQLRKLCDTEDNSSISYPCNAGKRRGYLQIKTAFTLHLTNPFHPDYPACFHQHRLSVKNHPVYYFRSLIFDIYLLH